MKKLRNKYRQQPVAILGAGPNLPNDLKKIPKESILIGINHHACRLVDVDYLVFADNPRVNQELFECSILNTGKRLTHIKGFSDWDFDGIDYWEGGMSATFATWIACYMRGNPVLLCGMDCYQNGYFYKPGVPLFPLEDVLKAWRKVFAHCQHPEVIRAVSGPLVEVFGKYNG